MRKRWMLGVRVLVGVGVLGVLVLGWIPASTVDAAHTQVNADRWLEIDLYWFHQQKMNDSVRQFWDRFDPLYAGVSGYRGLILNIGWTVGPVMEWSGDLGQRISLPKGSGQEKWVEESGPLTGTTEERQKKWRARFAGAVAVERHGYDPWTYGDVKALIAALKKEADRRGIGGFKVGMLNYAWTNAYGETATWAKLHPEAFTQIRSSQGDNFSVGRFFDPGATLHADASPLGGLVNGITEGMPVHAAYAAQWGSLSRALGLDAIMLRDSFGMPVPYQRAGPWGALAPSAGMIRKATDAVAALVKETKLANPDALVMMYSNASSAVSDWRSNGLDLETIAAQGYLDIWVDQTWAGAWNEVGIREGNFWNAPTKGWTYQLAYMLVHAAALANSKVRHYPLVETFDAWESWDVIHSAPERLRWGIWAYSHVAVKTPGGLKMPAGTYISWANQGERLLDARDVKFLSDNINAAVTDAQNTKEVFGPTIVVSREAMQWQIDHAVPDRDANEWIDEQMGSAVKWPVPLLSVTRMEWLATVQSDLFVLQTPSHLSAEHLKTVEQMIEAGQPMALVGSFAGGIDPELLRLAGVNAEKATAEWPARKCAAASEATHRVANGPASFGLYCQPTKGVIAAGAKSVYLEDGSPALTIDTSKGKNVAAWDAPDLRSIEGKPLKEIWGNTGEPYALAAGVFSELLGAKHAFHAERIDANETMSMAAWRTQDGKYRVLAGNLEEGLRDDADFSRRTTLVIPATWRLGAATWRDAWSGREVGAKNGSLAIELKQAQSALIEAEP